MSQHRPIDRYVGSMYTEYSWNGYAHRPNGPARIFKLGDWMWYKLGVYHRYYGPAHCLDSWFIDGRRIK